MIPRLKSVILLASCSLFAADNLPIGGISHVGFRVADLEKTRAFYTGILGIQQAFDQKDASGKTTLAIFKIDEDQFLEFAIGIPAGTADRFTHLAFLTQKLEALRLSVESLGLNPPDLRTGRDRTRNFSIKDADGHRIEFVSYEPDSMHAQARGKFADNRRLSTHLQHVGIAVSDRGAAMAFFHDKLGFVESTGGLLHPAEAPGDNIELLSSGAASHLCFDVPDMEQAMRTLRDRGLADGAKILDPDGTVIELTGRPKPAPR